MGWWMITRIAGRALMRNKMRSFLTMLGIIIGVAAVITMVALGTGAQTSIQDSIAALGSNTITISAGSVTSSGVRTGAFGSARLRVEDARAVAQHVHHLAAVTPLIQRGSQVVFQEQNWATNVLGVNQDYQNIRNWSMASGRFLQEDDIRASAKICVLGSVVAEQLFPNQDPLGHTVRIGRVPVRVVGVLTSKGEASFGPSQDDVVVVPYSTAMRRLFNTNYLRNITASAVSEDAVTPAVEEITRLLRERHRLGEKEEDDFTVQTQAEFAQAAAQSTMVFTMLLGGIASVSLLVGGIGIMNIMLVSVTERIREIGIRMALGARGSDILRQFLVEAMMLSLLGGVLGVTLAWILTEVGSHFMPMPLQISLGSVVLAFAFSAGVGIFFGLYPAVSASRLDPIQALRHE
ncbi:MAG: FtsX-like permease family protein [Burkholderiales bacterium]|nr:FtsX-like permease family protein [Burkholderiales bacterium]